MQTTAIWTVHCNIQMVEVKGLSKWNDVLQFGVNIFP
jgi:hypothetical protein